MSENPKSVNPTGILEGYTKAEPFHPTSEMRELVAQLREKFRDAEKHRMPFDFVWTFNHLYLQGNQIIGRDIDTNQIVRIRLRPEDRKHLLSIENLLRPTARSCVGKLTRVIATCEVLPASEDTRELEAVAVANGLLEHLTIKEGLKVKYLKAKRTLMWCGTSVYQPAWDRTAGRDRAWCSTCDHMDELELVGQPCPRCTLEAEVKAQESFMKMNAVAKTLSEQRQAQGFPPAEQPQMPQPQAGPPLIKVNEGDIVVHKLDTREFFPEPGVADHKRITWAFVRRAIPVVKARKLFPEAAAFIRAEDGIYSDKTLQFYGNLQTSAQMRITYLKDHVYVYEYHEIPSELREKGCIIYMLNDLVPRIEDNVYYDLFGRLGFYYDWFERNENDFWGESPIVQAWRPQRERNKLLTQGREHRELTMRPKMLVPGNTNIGVDEITTTPGEILRYNNFAGQPRYLEIPDLPMYYQNELERMRGGIQLQFSVTDQEMGVATGDPSGRFAAIQEAQSSESIAPLTVEGLDEWKELHRALLLLAQHFYRADRTFTVYGHDRVRSFSWAMCNLRPGWDIILSEADSLSSNRALRQQQAREYLQDGVFTDPRTGMPDMRKYMRVAGLKLPGVGPDQDSNEHSYFAKVPEMIAQGIPFQPQVEDDAAIAVEELTGWLRGPGRTAPAPVTQIIRQIYLWYLQRLISPAPMGLSTSNQATQTALGQGPGPMPQQGQGTQNSPGQQAPVQPVQQGNVTQDAAHNVQQADKAAERAARGMAPHEG
jgi:hypothetical protein